MNINEKKTKIMIFQKRSSKKTKQRNFQVNHRNLDIVKEFTYLGVTLNQTGDFLVHQEKSREKALNALFSINRHLDLKKLRPRQANKIYNSMVSPILTYASEIWGVYQKHDYKKWDKGPTEKMQLRFCKYYLGVNNKSTNIACRAELGIYPLKIFIDKMILKYYNHLFSLPDNSFAKQALLLSKSMFERGKTCYHSQLISMLNFYDINNTLTNAFTNNTINNYHERMKKHYLKEWKSHLVQSTKLQLYKSIKYDYKSEEYLDIIKNVEQRRLLTKFRISNHKLAIETGRYGKQKTQVDQRICVLCNNREIETEEHMLLHCPCYSSLRQKCFGKILVETEIISSNDCINISILLSSKNPKIIFYISKFIEKCFELRATLVQ